MNYRLAYQSMLGLLLSHAPWTLSFEKVVIPCAGLGTRLLPITKSIPKEMIPLLDRPAIEYIIQECAESAITSVGIITNDQKKALEHYFSHQPALEAELKEKKKDHFLVNINTLIDSTKFTFIPQTKALGLGHAVLMAREFVGNEFFSVILPDDLIIDESPTIKALIDIAKREHASVIAVQEVPLSNISAYGVIDIKKTLSENVFELRDLVEKPAAQNAPSSYGIVGRYVLSPKIFDAIEHTSPQALGEIQLTDAIAHLVRSGERVLAYVIKGQRYDIGTTNGWISSMIAIGLQHPQFKRMIKGVFKSSRSHPSIWTMD